MRAGLTQPKPEELSLENSEVDEMDRELLYCDPYLRREKAPLSD